MVNGVSSSSAANIITKSANEENVKKLVKYINNETLTEVPDTFSSSAKGGLSSAGLFEGIPLFNLFRRNKKLNGSIINDSMRTLGQNNRKALSELLHGEGKLSSRILDYIQSTGDAKKTLGNIKSSVKKESTIAKLEAKAGKAAEKAATKGSASAEKAAVKSAEKLNECKKAAGATKTVVNTTTKAAGVTGKIKNLMKSSGAKGILIFSGILETITEVIPTFKELGPEKGVKQIGKSSVRVLGDTIGFIAGEQAGVALGTAIGTAIFPGVGTAIGAVTGFVTGCLGSWAAGKITKKITGPSERELAQEEQLKQTAQEIFNNNSELDELKNEVRTKINDELAINGELDENSLAAQEALKQIEENADAA